jgi:hypothetical protein
MCYKPQARREPYSDECAALQHLQRRCHCRGTRRSGGAGARPGAPPARSVETQLVAARSPALPSHQRRCQSPDPAAQSWLLLPTATQLVDSLGVNRSRRRCRRGARRVAQRGAPWASWASRRCGQPARHGPGAWAVSIVQVAGAQWVPRMSAGACSAQTAGCECQLIPRHMLSIISMAKGPAGNSSAQTLKHTQRPGETRSHSEQQAAPNNNRGWAPKVRPRPSPDPHS